MEQRPQDIFALARRKIILELTGFEPPRPPLTEELKNWGASFVTLKRDGRLRGCIGSLLPRRGLADDIESNGFSAAFCDPRFEPLSLAEYEEVVVDVSILSEPQPLPYANVEELKRIIHPGVDGIILESGVNRATFLPQVWEELPTFDLFFAHLGNKAGLGSDPLSLHPRISRYRVDLYKEER